MEVATQSLELIEAHAEEIALGLIKNDLRSNEPSLAGLCQKLERFRPMLVDKDVSNDKVKALLKQGFKMARYTPGSTDLRTESIGLLNALADKLGGGILGSMF